MTGLPAAPLSPWLKGRNPVAGPSSFATIATSLLLTAKCTSAPVRKGEQRLGGLALGTRQTVEARYGSMASPTLWVKSVFNFNGSYRPRR